MSVHLCTCLQLGLLYIINTHNKIYIYIYILIKIINKNQSYFIKGRYIGDNIRSLLEVIDLAEEENLSCIALSIDFEKAFDTISWKFMLTSNCMC